MRYDGLSRAVRLKPSIIDSANMEHHRKKYHCFHSLSWCTGEHPEMQLAGIRYLVQYFTMHLGVISGAGGVGVEE